MIAKFRGKCGSCQGQILPGDNIVYVKETGKVYHRGNGCTVLTRPGYDVEDDPEGYDRMRDRWLENGGGFGAPKPWRS